jgi:trigger factor
MKVQVENVSPVEKKVTVEVDPEQVAQELGRAYSVLSRKVKLRGFRPGKAPRPVLERHFKDQVENEVIEKLVSLSYQEIVEEHSLSPVAPPKVSLGDTSGLHSGGPLKYTARVEVKPAVKPRGYDGLEVSRVPPTVTDAMVDDELARIQDGLAQLEPVEDRDTAMSDDYGVIDYEGAIDGKPFEGGKGEAVTVRVQAGEFTEGNMEGLRGKKVGEVHEQEYAFPATYRMEGLRNKVAHFKVTLKAIKVRKVPPLDDELAKDLGMKEVSTLVELKARIRADLDEREKRRAEGELRDALIKAALKMNEFDVPTSLVERAIDGMLEGAMQRFARQGIDPRQLDLDIPRLRADLREQALLQVKGALLLEAIADEEKLGATEEDVQAEIAKMAAELKQPLAKIQQQIKAGGREALKGKIREDKALALLTSKAKITEAPPRP